MRQRHEQYLLELTGLPTAAGREEHVIRWVQRWAKRRTSVRLTRDRYGNLLLARKGARSSKPVYITAHMDHPAFVVIEQTGPRRIMAEFRGGVDDRYFVGSRVRLHLGGIEPCRGRVVELSPPDKAGGDKRAEIELVRPVVAEVGDIVTWDLPMPKIVRGRLRAPACDDLAGVAAAISAFEQVCKSGANPVRADVRVLLTRSEEVGFIGAIGACRSGIIPKGALLIALETSRSYADSPIGGGPILRVGDRTSSFDPDLTYRLGRIAQTIREKDGAFIWQRKLMPGGTCEASAYQALGYTATCLCLALGNYHNMRPIDTTGRRGGRTAAGRIDSEVISMADYHGLIRWLVEAGRRLSGAKGEPGLKSRLDSLFAQRRHLLQ